MSNLLTLTQDEIDRYNIKGKQPGDVITAEEYSKYQKEYQERENKNEGLNTAEKGNTSEKTSKKK